MHQCAPPLSFASAPLVAALLLRWFSWREILLIWGGISLLSAFLYSFLGKGGEFPGRVLSVVNVKAVCTTWSFWIMLVLFSMAMCGNAGIFAMLPLYFVEERGFDLTLANTLIGVAQLSGIVMLFFAGWLTDKIGQKKMMASALLCAAILTVLLSCTKGWVLVVVLFLQPAALTAFFPAGFAALSRIAPPSLRSVVSALGPSTAFLIRGGIMPAIIGYMAETYSFSIGILYAGCFIFLGPVLVYFIRLGDYDAQDGC